MRKVSVSLVLASAGLAAWPGMPAAAPIAGLARPAPRLPVQPISVFCGTGGCLPVTHVKHCALPPTQKRTVGYTPPPPPGERKDCRF